MNQKLVKELKSIGATTLFFGSWIFMLVLLKKLILAEYDISIQGFSVVVIGALVFAKVVLILEHVPLGSWVEKQAAWVDVLFRTILYAAGLLLVLLLEKAFEGRGEAGGFVASLSAVFEHADIYHVLANTICMTGALLSYNLLSVFRAHLGEKGLRTMLHQPIPREQYDK